jgi:hypothetical protein
MADRLYQFEKRYEKNAEPFEWKFTREDLKRTFERIEHASVALPRSARGDVGKFAKRTTKRPQPL